MSYYIIIRGPLGSGKSTISKKLVQMLDAQYVGMDEVLEKHGLDTMPPDALCIPPENFIKANDIVLPEVKKILMSGKIVIFDACFYHKEVIEHLVENLKIPHFIFTLKAPLELCIKRDSERSKTHGEGAVSAVHSLVSRFDYGNSIDVTESIEDTLKNILSYLPSEDSAAPTEKKKILITGIAGSGKSTLCKELATMGYEAYGIEDIDGMFAMYRKGTKELFVDFDNSDPEKIKNSTWLCDTEKLKELLAQQCGKVAFYCGVASNMDDLFQLFDQVLLLKADATAIHARLSAREGTEDMGNTEMSRQTVLGWKEWWEEEMTDRSAVVVDANGNPHAVAEQVLVVTKTKV